MCSLVFSPSKNAHEPETLKTPSKRSEVFDVPGAKEFLLSCGFQEVENGEALDTWKNESKIPRYPWVPQKKRVWLKEKCFPKAVVLPGVFRHLTQSHLKKMDEIA